MHNTTQQPLTADEISQVIELAWADEVSFNAIEAQFGLAESQVIELMRRELKAKSFRNWRARVTGRHSKHAARGATPRHTGTLRADNGEQEDIPAAAFGDDAPVRARLT
ncbi:TIGR03643 family protein [Comamonadaceae bacterium M7527]|nr:TIGR03643 family protein [Comamonadaceae bacterium M7527]